MTQFINMSNMFSFRRNHRPRENTQQVKLVSSRPERMTGDSQRRQAASSSRASKPSPAASEATAWRTAVDPATSKLYYWNIHTREARWKKPIELASPSEREEMKRKEAEQKSFFQEMERNVLKRMQEGGLGVPASVPANQAPSSPFNKAPMSPVARESSIDSILTESCPYDECLTPLDDALQIQDSWVQSWIDNTSPITFDSNLASPISSSGSITSCEDEKDDKIMPLKKSAKKIEKAVDKPKLVRTISKMEYDLTLLLRGVEESPTGVDLLTPGDRSASDLLALLCITPEAEGVGCNLLLQPLSPGNTSISSEDTEGTGPSSDVAKPNLAKRNTCGTIYLGSTLSSPDKDALIKCVCGVFRAHLLQNESGMEPLPSDKVFNDDYTSSKYGITSKHLNSFIPTLEDITNFYRDIFLKSQMEIDCIVISLIYIERLIKQTEGRLRPTATNWKSLLYACMVLASKVWDDLSMWNADFSKITPQGMSFTLKRTNELEIALLNALEYKVKVGASEYAKYYFLLRSMLCRSGLASDNLTSLDPLDADGVKSLNKTSGSFCDFVVAKPVGRVRSKSTGDAEKKQEDGGEASFGAAIGGSPKVLTHKVSLEHLVRM